MAKLSNYKKRLFYDIFASRMKVKFTAKRLGPHHELACWC